MERVLESSVPDAAFFLAGSIFLRVPEAQLAFRAVVPRCLAALRCRPATSKRDTDADMMADTLDTFAKQDNTLGPEITAWKLELNAIVSPPPQNPPSVHDGDDAKPPPEQRRGRRPRGGRNHRRRRDDRSRSRDSSSSRGRGGDDDLSLHDRAHDDDESDAASSSSQRPLDVQAVPRVVVSASHAANAAKLNNQRPQKTYFGTVAIVCGISNKRSLDCYILADDEQAFDQPSVLCASDTAITRDSVGARVEFTVKRNHGLMASILDIDPQATSNFRKSRAIPRDAKRYVGYVVNVDWQRKYGFLKRDLEECSKYRRGFPKDSDGKPYERVWFHFSHVAQVGVDVRDGAIVEFTLGEIQDKNPAADFLTLPPPPHGLHTH